MADNRRIVKNTLFLAMRMPVVLLVGLFTSRVVLQQLGEVDFGVYQVVGGFVLLIAFINSALITSIQRFMNVELAKGSEGNLQQVFAAACKCILLVVIAFLIIAATGGLWVVDRVLSIPPDRFVAARFVYVCAVVTMVIEFFRVPYFASLVAHERMGFYTWHTIIDAALKLSAGFMLFVIGDYRLEFYMLMLVGVAIVLNVVLVLYCRSIFPHLHFSFHVPLSRVREIGKFVGWTSLNSMSTISYQQGGNVILNVFYGVTLNATMGITNQVKSGVTALARNVLLASSPPMIRAFNTGDTADFLMLFTRITRIVFYIILLLGLPVLLNADFILHIWLTKIPPSAIAFMQAVILFCMVDALTGPLETAMYACGRLGTYQISVCVLWVLYLPLLFLCYWLGGAAVWVINLQIVMNILIVGVRFFFVRRFCGISLRVYFRQALWPIVKVVAIGVPLPVIVAACTSGATCFFASSATACVAVAGAILLAGLTASERHSVVGSIAKKFSSN